MNIKPKELSVIFVKGYYLKLKKWKNNGSLEHVDYFDENGIRIKRNIMCDGFLTKEISYEFYDKVRRKRHFTKDGFCYLTEHFNHKGHEEELFLFDKVNNKIFSFDNITEFHKHFLTELCELVKKNPI